jgi:hypothetical protein
MALHFGPIAAIRSYRSVQSAYKKKPESKRKRRKLLYKKIVDRNVAAEESHQEGYD